MFVRALKSIFAVCVCIFVCLLVWGMGATRLSALNGTRSYYLYSPSSQAKITENPSFWDLKDLQGESVSFASEGDIGWILQKYDGEVALIEEAGGVTSYYCYTPKWRKGVRVGGKFVNLHIAVGQGRCTVGTPIIFGGF